MSHYKPGPWTLNGKQTNAHLLDAAADLYEALEALVADWDKLTDECVPDEINDNDHWDAARAALAKVRGES